MICRSSSSEAPERKTSLKDTSEFPNKHTWERTGRSKTLKLDSWTATHTHTQTPFNCSFTLRLPSAVMRKRLQEPQKWSDMEVMKPNCPLKPCTLNVCYKTKNRVKKSKSKSLLMPFFLKKEHSSQWQCLIWFLCQIIYVFLRSGWGSEKIVKIDSVFCWLTNKSIIKSSLTGSCLMIRCHNVLTGSLSIEPEEKKNSLKNGT